MQFMGIEDFNLLWTKYCFRHEYLFLLLSINVPNIMQGN